MKKLVLFLMALIGISATTQAQFTLADSSQVSTFAGSGATGNNNGLGSAASFFSPQTICIDAQGNLYVVDQVNYLIRKISSSGLVSTVAGNGVQVSTDGVGAAAGIGYPNGICCDATGNLYFTDVSNAVSVGNISIRKVSAGGVVSTLHIISTGTEMNPNGIGGDLCVDASGSNLFIIGGDRILKLNLSTLVLSVFAGPSGAQQTGYQDGPAGSARFTLLDGICIDNAGNLYVADGLNNRIRKITTSGTVSTVAGSGSANTVDGNGTSASFNWPSGICVDNLGNLYVTELTTNKVRKIYPNGHVVTMAGDGSSGYIDDIGTKAEFGFCPGAGNGGAILGAILATGAFIGDIAVNNTGDLFIPDGDNNLIRKIKKISPTVPVVNYPSLPAHICMGSSVNYQPASTGSSAHIIAQVDSILIAPQKAICKNNSSVFVLCQGDSILRYDLNGNYQQTYPWTWTNVNAIAADNQNRVYVVSPDPNNTAISTVTRFAANGSMDGLYSYPSYSFGYITGIAFNPADGYVYIADTTTGYLNKLDTGTAAITALPVQQNNAYSYYKPSGLSFGANGQLFLSDKGLNDVLVRDAATGNYYKYFSNLDTLKWQLNGIEADTFGVNEVLLTTPAAAYYLQRQLVCSGDTQTEVIDLKLLGVHVQLPMGITCSLNSLSVPVMWLADNASNYLKRAAILGYQITPNLPAGLKYDFISGKIVGTPQVATLGQTYSITVTGVTGISHTSTIYFSVDPPSPLSNANGSINSNVVNQTDGLTINYNDTNNCSKLMTIADSIRGASPGMTQITQTVYPTIATFATGQFVPRVNQVNAQNPNSPAGLTMYFTYQDIVNFNTSNTAGQHLSNDTTGGTMQVAVMQLHKDSNGHVTAIPHNPITAKWISHDKDWEVDFPVTKFSTFYMGTTVGVTSFNCVNGHADTIVTTNPYYLWHNDTLKTTGDYADTLANKNLCDSICTMHLTINQASGIATPLLDKSVSVYPNPSSGLLNIDITNPNVAVNNIRIINLIGQEVYNSNANNLSTKIDLSSLPNGVYIISITSQQETTTRRILKE